jgi:hypothetical protein
MSSAHHYLKEEIQVGEDDQQDNLNVHGSWIYG